MIGLVFDVLLAGILACIVFAGVVIVGLSIAQFVAYIFTH